MKIVSLLVVLFLSMPVFAGSTDAGLWSIFMRRTVEQDVALFNELEKKKGYVINGKLYMGSGEVYMDALGTVRIDNVPIHDPVGTIMPIYR